MKKSIISKLVVTTLMAICAVWYSCSKEIATGSIYGTVTDFVTGKPIGNANVKLRPSGETTLTGNDGTYEFKDLKTGKYSLSFSKAEYADLDDDYIIELEAGKSVKRDVQMRKQVASLRITDMSGKDIDTLDFGTDESVTSKSFNIFNNGTINIECVMSYNCRWIDTVIMLGSTISPGQTLTATIVIDREKLSSGENKTYLHIISNNGSNELLITAIGPGAPAVRTDEVNSITSTSAVCVGTVVSGCGYEVTDRGFCWSSTIVPTIVDCNYQSIGVGTGVFSGMITGLTPSTNYYVRAYAINEAGTSYGTPIAFTTNNGLPIVTTIEPTRNGLIVQTGGNVTSDEGYEVTARGVCYGTAPLPDLSPSHNHTSDGIGTGSFSSSFTMSGPGTYYIRAYATNANGTAYGQPVSVNSPYNDLPSFTYGGQTYKVAPTAPITMDWEDANNYCDTLTLFGYTDWRLPSLLEWESMWNARANIGGLCGATWWCNNYHPNYAHSLVRIITNCTAVYWDWDDDDALHYVRPIRMEY